MPEVIPKNVVLSGWSLAYIGTASTIEFDVSLRVDPRRFD
jgi:hypothetical protein